MILAAGFGTRLQPLSHVRPKALLPCFTFPQLELVLNRLRDHVVGEILVNLHHQADRVEEATAAGTAVLPIREERILGTGGGIANAVRLHAPAAPLLVHNVDVISDLDLEAATAAYTEDPAYAALLLHHHPGFLQVHLDGERITKFGAGGTQAYTGIMILSTEAQTDLAAGAEFSIIDFLSERIASGCRVKGLVLKPGLWLDTGRADGYLEMHRRYLHDTRYRELVNGLLPAPPRLQEGCFCGEDVEIDPGVEVKETVIWDRVRIKSGPVRGAVITDGVVIEHPVTEAMVV